MRLVLARHGQTLANVEGILDSRPPGHPLTEEGRRQAASLAETLAGDDVVAVCASRALRAQQTAEAVASRIGRQVQVLSGVHEVQLGELEGRTDADAHELFHNVYRAWHAGELDRRVPGGESGTEVLDRYLADLARLRAAHPEGTVLLVSHGASMRLAAARLAGNVDGEFAEPHYMPNARTIVLKPDGAAWRCLRWNDVDLP